MKYLIFACGCYCMIQIHLLYSLTEEHQFCSYVHEELCTSKDGLAKLYAARTLICADIEVIGFTSHRNSDIFAHVCYAITSINN